MGLNEWKHFVEDSGITLTKLVGVIVLCFARSEIFVVRTPKSIALCRSWSLAWVDLNGYVLVHTGVLLPNVLCFGYNRLLAWAHFLTCKLIWTYLLPSTDLAWPPRTDSCTCCGFQVILSLAGPPPLHLDLEEQQQRDEASSSPLSWVIPDFFSLNSAFTLLLMRNIKNQTIRINSVDILCIKVMWQVHSSMAQSMTCWYNFLTNVYKENMEKWRVWS